MSITTTTTTTPTVISDRDEQLAYPAIVPVQAGATSAAPEPAEGLCGELLTSVPADTEHLGWICIQPQGHLPGSDHSAEDGTTW